MFGWQYILYILYKDNLYKNLISRKYEQAVYLHVNGIDGRNKSDIVSSFG